MVAEGGGGMMVPPPRGGRMMMTTTTRTKTTKTEMTTGHRPSRGVVCKRMSDDARAMTKASDSGCLCWTTSRGCTHVGSLTPRGLRGSIPGGVEMRGKGDDGGRGRGGRGTISSVLGGALSLLIELRERMVSIASSFAA